MGFFPHRTERGLVAFETTKGLVTVVLKMCRDTTKPHRHFQLGAQEPTDGVQRKPTAHSRINKVKRNKWITNQFPPVGKPGQVACDRFTTLQVPEIASPAKDGNSSHCRHPGQRWGPFDPATTALAEAPLDPVSHKPISTGPCHKPLALSTSLK